MIDIQKIIKLIPHRYPILLVDRVKEIDGSKKIVAIKNVTFNEPHFLGHFPDKPIMPGVLIIEAMAQAGSIMVASSGDFDPANKLVYFMSISEAKFRKPVVPGDVLELHIVTTQNRGAVWKMQGNAFVDGVKVAEAQFSAIMVDKKDALI